MLILAVDHQSDAGIALGIQSQLTDLAYRQPLVPERRPFIEPRQIVGLQSDPGATDLILAAQGHGPDPVTFHVVKANGRAGQQAIRMFEAGGTEGDSLPDEATVAGDPKCLFRVDQRRHHPTLVGQANGVNPANLDPFEKDGHSLLDGQITGHYVDPLATGRFGQPLVEDEGLAFLRLGGGFGGVKRYAAAQYGGKAAGLHIDPGQAEGAFDATDVPKAGIGLDEVFETRLDHQIQDHVLVVLAETGVDDTAYLNTAEIEFGADPDRSQRIGGQVQHAPLCLIAGGRAIQRIKLLFQRVVLPTGLQIDVVARDQGIQARDLGE